MFVGREEELAALEERYALGTFQMVVLYGRRRVGKTTLLERFCSDKPALMFTAQVQTDIDNLRDFSRTIVSCFGLPHATPPFATWMDALEFVAEKGREAPFVFVFDEFPYAARANPALPSAFQIAIDRFFSGTGVFMVLCGSNQGFMENEVLGEKSPLYGRRTAQLRLGPFDYHDAARMLPDCPAQEKISYYASLGGTPYYLAAVDPKKSYLENMEALFFDRMGLMFEEPTMLLRQELREPAVYGSVMRAIADGVNRSNAIADRVGIPTSSVTPYLKTLAALGLVERVVPFGESERSKRSQYRIKDPAFAFWYRFVGPYATAVEAGLGAEVAERLLSSDRRTEYEGHLFEQVCRAWVVRQARVHGLPITPTYVGSWWGTDSARREQVDIDVVAVDEIDKRALLGECKWRNEFNEAETLGTLQERAHLVPGCHACCFYVFSKNPAEGAARREASRAGDVHFVSADELFD